MINTTDDAKKIRWVLVYAAVYLIRYIVVMRRDLPPPADVIDRHAANHADQISERVENKLKAR